MKKKTPEERMAICKKCPHLGRWKVCDKCKCFMPLKTKIRWAECPLEPPKWTQWERSMPKGKGTYGSKVGRPKKKKKGKKKKSMGGLTAAQKKLPKALQAAILKKKRKKK